MKKVLSVIIVISLLFTMTIISSASDTEQIVHLSQFYVVYSKSSGYFPIEEVPGCISYSFVNEIEATTTKRFIGTNNCILIETNRPHDETEKYLASMANVVSVITRDAIIENDKKNILNTEYLNLSINDAQTRESVIEKYSTDNRISYIEYCNDTDSVVLFIAPPFGANCLSLMKELENNALIRTTPDYYSTNDYLLSGYSPSGTVDTREITGDFNADGKVTVEDARLCLRTAIGFNTTTYYALSCCDFDQNGKLDASDARFVLRLSIGLPVNKTRFASSISMTSCNFTVNGTSAVYSSVLRANDRCSLSIEVLLQCLDNGKWVDVSARKTTARDTSISISGRFIVKKDGAYRIVIIFDANSTKSIMIAYP